MIIITYALTSLLIWKWWGVNFIVLENSDLYRVSILRMRCLDNNSSCVLVIRNGGMSGVVKIFGLLIIRAMKAIVCRIGSQGQVGVQRRWLDCFGDKYRNEAS